MFLFLKKHKWALMMWFGVIAYSVYFSYFTILRYQTLYASYFDLGIMHQTVFNSYKAFATIDWSRLLELTNPFNSDQIKRMAIHNDLILAPIALLYFIHSGPETLLVLQSIVVAFGAVFIYHITQTIFKTHSYKNVFALIFTFSYLLYPALQRMNMYEFHAVALATTTLLGMFYFWLTKRFVVSFLFFVLSILTKEQVALTTLFFGLYVLYVQTKKFSLKALFVKKNIFAFTIIVTSLVWFSVVMGYVIPSSRGGHHFALGYYGDFGDSPFKIFVGIIQHPASLARYIFHIDTFKYLTILMGPVGFMSLFSLPVFLIATPEFGINLLSNTWHMRNIVFHYTAVIQPFIFISAIYGLYYFITILQKKYSNKDIPRYAALYLIAMTVLFAYFKGPLPFAREQEIHPFRYPQAGRFEILRWKEVLQSDHIKVSTTGQLAPHFTSRRYFYIFSKHYPLADYILLRTGEIYNYPEKDILIPVYEQLVVDPRFTRIYKQGELEVYKKNVL